MLIVEVAAVNGAPPAVPMSAQFEAAGGSIGRDPTCTLMLPDPEKRISRRHVLIAGAGGRFSLRNQGSAIAVLLNGRQVEYGSEVPVAGGDRIDIGAYSLCVRDEAATRVPPQSARPATPAGPVPDILADFGPAAGSDPFADLIPPSAPARRPKAPPTPPTPPSQSRPAGATPRPAADQIPDDFDPFGEPRSAPELLQEPQRPRAGGDFSDLVPPSASSIDELFGLKGGDAFPEGHPLAASSAAMTPGPVGIDDLLGRAPPPVREPASPPRAHVQRDDASELNARIRLPTPTGPDLPTAPEPMPEHGATDSVSGGDMMLSWEQGDDDGHFDAARTVVVGGSTGRRREPRPASFVGEGPAPAAAAEPAGAGAASDAALLVALLDGLGLDRWPGEQGLDAASMKTIGKLLRAAMQGTLDLLRARATIKSEVQAHMTMIVTRGNNPLKFSPNVEVALAHLLGPTQRGFLGPTEAVDDAYRDLVAHQFGFTAGTRAALADVLRRFDPVSLEQRLAGRSMLDSLMPAHRKAKLWDMFAERFGQIYEEAEEDFQRLFGKEFLRAYEEQVAKLSRTDDGDTV
jgi:FHA domain-containing protein